MRMFIFLIATLAIYLVARTISDSFNSGWLGMLLVYIISEVRVEFS